MQLDRRAFLASLAGTAAALVVPKSVAAASKPEHFASARMDDRGVYSAVLFNLEQGDLRSVELPGIDHTRETLESGDRDLARRAIHQFVAKIVIKNGTGTLYYTFPLEDELYMPSKRSVDLKGLEPLASTVRL